MLTSNYIEMSLFRWSASEIKDLIKYLLEQDYIETEVDEDIYYLTLSGYAIVEHGFEPEYYEEKPSKELTLDSIQLKLEKIGSKKLHQYIFYTY